MLKILDPWLKRKKVKKTKKKEKPKKEKKKEKKDRRKRGKKKKRDSGSSDEDFDRKFDNFLLEKGLKEDQGLSN